MKIDVLVDVGMTIDVLVPLARGDVGMTIDVWSLAPWVSSAWVSCRRRGTLSARTRGPE